MTEELKACPFCGGEAQLQYKEWPIELYHVLCVHCGGSSCSAILKDIVINLWNRRIGYE